MFNKCKFNIYLNKNNYILKIYFYKYIKIMNYVCKRCGYETNFKSNMKTHLERRLKCPKNINVIDVNDIDLYNLSLNSVKDKSKKNFVCKVCNKKYSRIDSYNKHLKNNKECDHENNKNISFKNVLNSNITCGDTINNNINIYILPFDDSWTIDHFTNKDKSYIVNSLMKYTTLLTELLENDKNLNVIVEENNDDALVFKNVEEKYVNIEKKDLYSKTMKNLKTILIEMTDKIITSSGNETNYSNMLKTNLKTEIEEIVKKYNDYEQNNEIRKNANISLEKVFTNKKNDAEIIAQKIIDGGY